MSTKVNRSTATFRILEDDETSLQMAKKRVQRLKGVLKVEIDHLSHVLSIEYDPEEITLERIRLLIRPAIDNRSSMRGVTA